MIKISSLEIENVKRIKAVSLTPAEDGLTIIGGDNNQGKTSVLDSIAWVLGGDRYKPSNPQREGSVIPPYLKVELTNGLIVERKGKNSDLKVTDPTGNKSGQQLLNAFVSQFALDLPKFLQSNNKEKADTLLRIIGVLEELKEIERDETLTYNERHSIGQIANRKREYAKELEHYEDVPTEIVSASELIQQQQAILLKNAENAKKRALRDKYSKELIEAERAFERAKASLEEIRANLEIATKEAEDLHDESTAELEKNIADIDTLNAKIRVNLEREKAFEEAAKYGYEYDALTEKLDAIRKKKYELLNGAEMPLEGLTVEDGELVYKGAKWDCMSSSQQLMVATAIVRKLNPSCGFVLLDKLEQMDMTTLKAFSKWLEDEGLQAIATRVSQGDECSVIITDGTAHMESRGVF